MSEYFRKILGKELRPMFGTDRTVALVAIAFAISLFAFEALCFPTTARRDVSLISNGLDLLGLCTFPIYFAVSFYLFVLFVQAAIASRWGFRFIYLALFGFIVLAEYSYQKALGRFSNFYDITAALSATNEQTGDSISAFINYLAVIPLIALTAIALFLPVRQPRFGWKMLIGLTVCIVLFYGHVSSVKLGLFQKEFPNNSFGAFMSSLVDYAVQTPIQLGPIERTKVRIPENPAKPQNNIVLVFDESIRADHLSLNGYERDTTPFLNKLKRDGLLLNWGVAVSAATSSHPSYDAFITGAQPDEIDNLSPREFSSLPTIFQYAKAMGYRTVMLDGQMMNYWGGTKDDLNYIDEFDSLGVIDRPDRVEDWQTAANKVTDESKRKEGLKQWEIDEHIAEMVNKIFTTSTGNFIFIYKRGCHFPYEKNFPPSDAVWQPVYHFQEQYEVPPSDKLQAVINSYDNSLRYNLDEFFRKLAPDYAQLPGNTVIVYTGDHGESFYENGKAGHGGETTGEAEVPLFILGMPQTRVDLGFKASHHNVFATLLDLMNYPVDLRRPGYSVSLLKATASDSKPRFFNPWPGRRVRFD